MANYYKLEQDLIVNEADGTKITIEAGKYVITEADGTLSGINEADLQTNIDRVDAEIVIRDEAIAQAEAERLAEEEAQQEEPEEEPVP